MSLPIKWVSITSLLPPFNHAVLVYDNRIKTVYMAMLKIDEQLEIYWKSMPPYPYRYPLADRQITMWYEIPKPEEAETDGMD